MGQKGNLLAWVHNEGLKAGSSGFATSCPDSLQSDDQRLHIYVRGRAEYEKAWFDGYSLGRQSLPIQENEQDGQ